MIAGTAVLCLKDLASDRAEHANEQVTGGLAQIGISGMVQHSEYTFVCAGWVGAANVRPNLLLVLGALSLLPLIRAWP